MMSVLVRKSMAGKNSKHAPFKEVMMLTNH